MSSRRAEKVDMPAYYDYYAYMGSLQYTIRNVPDATDRRLRSRARQTGKSLNEVVLEALNDAAGDAENHDLDFLFGSWQDDPETDRALQEQRKIDRNIWK